MGNERRRSGRQTTCEVSADMLIKRFKYLCLEQMEQEKLENFFSFQIHYRKNNAGLCLPCNLLIRSGYAGTASTFADLIQDCMKEILTNKDVSLRQVKENEMYRTCPGELMRDCDVLSILDCGSHTLEKPQERLELWRGLARQSCENGYGCLIIAAGSGEFTHWVRQKDVLPPHFFFEEICLSPMTEADVSNALMVRLKEDGIIVGANFRKNVEQYVADTYAEAQLKETDYIEDLRYQILRNYYIFGNATITKACLPVYQLRRNTNEILRDLDRMVGLSDVKAGFQHIADQDKTERGALLFAFCGRPGTGKATIARLLKDLLYARRQIDRNILKIITLEDWAASELLFNAFREAAGGVLMIRNSHFLISRGSDSNLPEKRCAQMLQKALTDYTRPMAVILDCSVQEMEQLLNDGGPLAQIMLPERRYTFEYSPEELLQILQQDSAGAPVLEVDQKDRKEILELIIEKEKDVSFACAGTMRELQQKLLRQGLKAIKASDVKAGLAAYDSTLNLQDLIGTDLIQEWLERFEARVSYAQVLKEKRIQAAPPNLNMLFMGQPGTGKTTVARRIADYLFRLGVLPNGSFVAAGRKELVGDSYDATLKKTEAMVKQAMNGVLFVNMDQLRDHDYAVIDFLVTAMNEYRDSMIFIFSGCQTALQHHLERTPDLKSRIGYTFRFRCYGPEALAEMFCGKLIRQGFSVEEKARKKAKEIMEYFSASEDFDNGHFVNRIIDYTLSNRAKRDYLACSNDIKAEDIPSVEYIKDVILGNWAESGNEMNKEQLIRIAVHELGHAIVLMKLDPDRGIDRVTVRADAVSSGKTFFEAGAGNLTESRKKAELAAIFGGRNAERLLFGEHSEGCVSDIQQARELARYLVDSMAVGEIGITTVEDLLREADKVATQVLSENKDKLRELTDSLIGTQKGWMSGSMIRSMLEE